MTLFSENSHHHNDIPKNKCENRCRIFKSMIHKMKNEIVTWNHYTKAHSNLPLPKTIINKKRSDI